MYSKLAVAYELVIFMEKVVYCSICLQMSLQYSDNIWQKYEFILVVLTNQQESLPLQHFAITVSHFIRHGVISGE